MTLRFEIMNGYLDKDGQVSPAKNSGSNNGLMYTSEYYILLKKNNELTDIDIKEFADKVHACMPQLGLLQRHPDGTGGQEGPDDYLGVLTCCYELGITDIPKLIIKHGLDHNGFYNNEVLNSYKHSDNRINWSAFLVRQPSLVTAAYWAAGLKPNFLLTLATACIILYSTLTSNSTTLDNWRLNWLLIQIAKDKSWLCNKISKLWYNKLFKVFPNGMKDVAAKYYEQGHPFSRYWMN